MHFIILADTFPEFVKDLEKWMKNLKNKLKSNDYVSVREIKLYDVWFKKENEKELIQLMKPKMRNLRLRRVKKLADKFMRFIPDLKKVDIDDEYIDDEERWCGQMVILGKLEDDEFEDGREMI